MPTIRTKKQKSPYTSISRVLLQDRTLTFEARGLASYLLSKPDNWEIDVDALIRESPAGRDAVYKMIKELCEAGYLIREKYRERGKFKYDYTLYETRELAAKHHFIGEDQPGLFDQFGKPILKSRTGEENMEADSDRQDSSETAESAPELPESQTQAGENDSPAPESSNQCGKPVLETSPDNQYWKPVLETSTEKPDWSCKEEQTTEQSSEQISEQTTEQQTGESPVVVVEFTEEQILAYARGQSNIENPVGFSKAVREGTAKDLPRIVQSIGEWLRDHAPPESEPAEVAEISMPGETDPQLSQRFLDQVQLGVNPEPFRQYFASLQITRGEAAIYIRGSTDQRTYIEGRYGEILGEVLMELQLTDWQIRFV